jgi:hypothetical protein
MEYRKSLIGAASILALSVGMNQTADASAAPPLGEEKVPLARDITSDNLADPLLELIVRTQGSFTEEAIRSALTSMYADATQADIDRLPELLNNIATLGIAPNVFEVSKQTLMDIISSAAMDDLAKEQIVAQLEHGAGLIQLAQSRTTQEEILRRRGRRDPAQVGQTREPGSVGQIGPGGY